MIGTYVVDDLGPIMEAPDLGESREMLPAQTNPFPKPILPMSGAKRTEFLAWLDRELEALRNANAVKQSQWAKEERLYRAESDGPQAIPFEGACGDHVPLIAMAVDPIHARLDVGIFKIDPVVRVKPWSKRVMQTAAGMEKWFHYYQKHRLELRRFASPRFLELAKHGTCIFKTIYDCEEHKVKTYSRDGKWTVVERTITKFKGPRVLGISIDDLLFPPEYQHIQDCPIVAERQRLTWNQLKVAEAAGKLANVDLLRGQTATERSTLLDEQAQSSNHTDPMWMERYYEVFEIWCDYDINGDGLPESIVCTYHPFTHTILQLRYNWYFHQRKPYTVIAYTKTNRSIYGMGICELVGPLQDMATKFHRCSVDNALLANTRGYIVKRDSGLDKPFNIYPGFRLPVDDPKSDVVPIQLGDIYQSTLTERQNIFGLAEKRTDFLDAKSVPPVIVQVWPQDGTHGIIVMLQAQPALTVILGPLAALADASHLDLQVGGIVGPKSIVLADFFGRHRFELRRNTLVVTA